MGTGKQYDEEFKKQAIKLAKEIGTKAAADELCIPKGTLGTWVQKARIGEIDTGAGSRTPGESLTIAQQLQAANKRIKELEKKNRELEELNEFLEEASADGRISFYCKALEVTRQAFYDHLSHKNAPWKYQALADEMMKIHEEDQYNDCYGREHMYLALQQRKAAGMLL